MNYQEKPELKEFNRLFKELMDLYYEVGVKSGLSESAYDILYALISMEDGCSQKEIADYYHTSRTTINSSLKKLEAQDYIYMSKGEGRNKRLYLTEKGERMAEQKIIPIMEMEASVFEEMQEGKKFLRLMAEYTRIYRKKVEQFS